MDKRYIEKTLDFFQYPFFYSSKKVRFEYYRKYIPCIGYIPRIEYISCIGYIIYHV